MSAFGGKADIAAKLLRPDEARRIAANIASCPIYRKSRIKQRAVSRIADVETRIYVQF
jgi:hypothetical protein